MSEYQTGGWVPIPEGAVLPPEFAIHPDECMYRPDRLNECVRPHHDHEGGSITP